MAEPKENEPSSLPSEDAPRREAPARTGTPEDPSRRSALSVLVGVGAVACAGAVAAPAVDFSMLSVSTGAAGERWIRVGKLDDLTDGLPTRLRVIGDLRDAYTLHEAQTLGAVWVIRAGDAVRALSAVCPHLGCAVDLGGDKKGFGCPCHSAKFDLDGARKSGPSPRAMDELATRVVDGWLEVDYRRYRHGIEGREEI
jgi:menaquinol-cytochrome c reductase iron-sulfur subunit